VNHDLEIGLVVDGGCVLAEGVVQHGVRAEGIEAVLQFPAIALDPASRGERPEEQLGRRRGESQRYEQEQEIAAQPTQTGSSLVSDYAGDTIHGHRFLRIAIEDAQPRGPISGYPPISLGFPAG